MKIAFLGDIALIGKYDTTDKGENAVYKRLELIKSVLVDCDYIIANLETPLTNIVSSHEPKSMPLRSNTANISILKYLGIDAVSLANNHIYDYGENGLSETIQTLYENNIEFFGVDNKPLFFESAKVSLQGFCCYTANGWHYDNMPGNGRLHTLTDKAVRDFCKESWKAGYYPVIIPHWGEENTHYPQSEHILIAKSILDNGKCSIVGHHPHVPQGLLVRKNGICAFSLGNFLFDDCYSRKNGMSVVQTEDNKKGFILVLDIDNGVLLNHKIIPYYDSDNGLDFDHDGKKHIEEYSQVINRQYGKPEYENKRQEEQHKARLMRLGKRDIKWLVNHLNYNSVLAVLHGKKNYEQFIEVVGNYARQEYNAFSDNQVLYVGNFGMPKTNAAGKRVYANSLLLSKCGLKVLMIGTDPSVKGDVKYLNKDISYMSFPRYGKSTGKKYFEWLKKQIEKSGYKPLMIIRYGSPGLSIFDQFLYTYCRKESIKSVIDVVDWLTADSGNVLFRIIKGIDTFFEKGVFNKQGDGLIAISSYLYNYYDKYHKYRIVLPPLVEKYISQEKQNDIPQIAYAGNPFRKGEPVKNVHAIKDRLDIAISAFASLEQKGVSFDFHVIGISREDYLVAFPKQKEMLEHTNHIHFHGYQPMEKTQDMISKMDYTILLRERTRGTMAGFPTKVVESLSLGVPVITTDTSDLSKYIVNGVNGYIININDDVETGKQIEEILTKNKENAQQLKEACKVDHSFLIDKYIVPFKSFLNLLTLS